MNKSILLSLITLFYLNVFLLTDENAATKNSEIERSEVIKIEEIRPTGVWSLGYDENKLP